MALTKEKLIDQLDAGDYDGHIALKKNYIINSNFLNPVNQRGVSGTISGAGYFIDMWKLTSGSVQITGNGLILNGTMTQTIIDGQPASATPSLKMHSGSATLSYSGGVLTVTSTGGTIKSVALYEGNIAAENIPPHVVPHYADELIRCQRCLLVLGGGAYEKFGIGMYSTATLASIIIKLPVTMRASPTPTMTGSFSLSGTVLNGSTFSNDGSAPNFACIKNTSVSGKTPGYSFLLYANNDASARIVISAEP